MSRLRLPRLAYNKLSFAGAIIAVITAILIILLLALESVEGGSNPYVGIFVFMVLPPVLVFGLVLIPFGMWRQKKRIQKYGNDIVPQWPRIDLNLRPHRNAFFVFLFGTLFFALISIVGGYHAFHFTESVTFCGTTCHVVMKPEHTAYQNSPHARVLCTECHVGSGANWYVKSKMSGLYQVYATLRNIYPTPIPTPIESLRPAAQTCEQCHWPEKFFGTQQRRFDHFMYDEGNTHWPISMLVKTGGGDPRITQTAGIHWHMNISVKMEYIARDERRNDIPWIRVTDRDGRETIYQDEGSPLTEEEIRSASVRRMDCIDCHNRPSHKYNSPDHLVDLALLTRQIEPEIPGIKAVAVDAMNTEYETEPEALDGIAAQMLNHYAENEPEYLEANGPAIERAIAATQRAFSQNMFPEMKVRWDRYPDNLGHFIYPGCMRCHDGEHVNDSGDMISRDCRSCHNIILQGTGDRAEMATTADGLDFVHPEDIGEAWMEMECFECHSGTQP